VEICAKFGGDWSRGSLVKAGHRYIVLHLDKRLEVSLGGEMFRTENAMKVLGVNFDDKMK